MNKIKLGSKRVYLRPTDQRKFKPEGTLIFRGINEEVCEDGIEYCFYQGMRGLEYPNIVIEEEIRQDWIDEVETIKNKISSGHLKKEVAYRRVDLTAGGYPSDIMHRIMRSGGFMHYCLTLEDGTVWFGNSPEKVIERVGSILRVNVLGGTAAKGQDLEGAKEREEHSLIIREIIEKLEEYGSPKLVLNRKALELPYARHLSSVIEMELEDEISNERLIDLVHPNLAVRGSNKADREFYGGVIGWENPKGDLHLWLNIRSGKWKEGKYTFWAGAGITSDSDPSLEWKETDLKLKWMSV